MLVRHHPHVDPGGRREQMARLKLLSDWIHDHDDTYYMFELLVPAMTAEDKALGDRYDVERRPGLMIEAIRELQDFGIEPDIWKIEGLERAEDAVAVAAQTRNTPARAKVGNILLGRGADKESVHRWLRVAAPLEGYIGFAVGRTNFSEPLKDLHRRALARQRGRSGGPPDRPATSRNASTPGSPPAALEACR